MFEKKVKVAQYYPSLWDPVDYTVYNSPGQNTRVGNPDDASGKEPAQQHRRLRDSD